MLFDERDDTPTIEVRIWHNGVLVSRELCETEEEAALLVDAAAEVEGVECTVDDLTFHHQPGDVAEPEPAEVRDEEQYAEALEQARQELEARRLD
jgi:hypothetical protein